MNIFRLFINFLLMGYNTCSIISIVQLTSYNTYSNYLLIVYDIYDSVLIRENTGHGKAYSDIFYVVWIKNDCIDANI